MSDLTKAVISEVSCLENEGRINRAQTKALLSMIYMPSIIEKFSKAANTVELRDGILKLTEEISISVSIPPNRALDDLSSPLDTFLLNKKREALKNRCSNEHRSILIKLNQDRVL
jgi:hypothetical protein